MRNRWTVTLIVSGLALVAAAANAYPRPGRTELAAGFIDERAVDSNAMSLSDDGRFVAFDTLEALVGADTNGHSDVYLRDRVVDRITLISAAPSGAAAGGASGRPSISDDGGLIAFQSDAADLVAGDTNGINDVFVRDVAAGTTRRVSVSTTGAQADDDAVNPAISGNGRVVVFESEATNLDPADVPIRYLDIYAYDLMTNRLDMVSLDDDERPRLFDAYTASVSDDGRYVTFLTPAPFEADDRNGFTDAYVRDRQAGTLSLGSMSSDDASGLGTVVAAEISGNGRFVAFHSTAADMVPGDTNGGADVFVRDLVAGTTEMVSVTSSGGVLTDWLSHYPGVSDDGRFVAFHTPSAQLDEADTNGATDVFVHDLLTGATTHDSIGSGGEQGNYWSHTPSISGDGRTVAFTSGTSTLVPGTEVAVDVGLLRDRGPAIGVGGLSVSDGQATGWASFSGAVLAQGVDSATDGAVNGGPVGAEITGARVVYRPELDDLFFRVDLADLPHVSPARGATGVSGFHGVRYTFSFTISNVQYQVRVVPVDTANAQLGVFELLRCTPTCAKVADLKGSVGVKGDAVVVQVPTAALGAAPGSEIKSLGVSTAFQPGGISQSPDSLTLGTATIPAPTVEVGTGTPTQEPASWSPAGTLSQGRFAVPVDEGGTVWARACLGLTCGPAVRAG